MSPVFDQIEGEAPLLISMPHSGTRLADDLPARMTAAGRRLPDTDWFVPQLYEFAESLNASVLRAHYSRYVIDLNRPPDGAALYPGLEESALCPLRTFEGSEIYLPGMAPDPSEVEARLAHYWRPYHDTLDARLEALCRRHGQVVLWDAHSIASEVPRLFDGRLPDLNLGTAGGVSCAPEVADAVFKVLELGPYAAVRDGRFKGGHITRAYGAPGRGVHALQMEIAQAAYMDEEQCTYRPDKAAGLTQVLHEAVKAALDACRALV